MLGKGPIELLKLKFTPEESIQFDLEPIRQSLEVKLENNEDVDIAIKWKSTRWTLFVHPSTSIVKSKSTHTFQFVFKGAEAGMYIPGDRYSGLISAIKPTTHDAKSIWKSKNLQKECLIGSRHKKLIFVEYRGLSKPNWWNIGLQTSQRTFGLVEEHNSEEDRFGGVKVFKLV